MLYWSRVWPLTYISRSRYLTYDIWDYNTITSFFPSFFSCQTLPYTLLCSLLKSLSFSIVITCIYKYIYICKICIFLNTNCPVCIILLVWIFLGLIIWYKITTWYILPWKRLFLLLQHHENSTVLIGMAGRGSFTFNSIYPQTFQVNIWDLGIF